MSDEDYKAHNTWQRASVHDHAAAAGAAADAADADAAKSPCVKGSHQIAAVVDF